MRLYALLVLVLAAYTLALADPEVHTTLALEVRTYIFPTSYRKLTGSTEIGPGQPSRPETICSSLLRLFLRVRRDSTDAGGIRSGLSRATYWQTRLRSGYFRYSVRPRHGNVKHGCILQQHTEEPGIFTRKASIAGYVQGLSCAAESQRPGLRSLEQHGAQAHTESSATVNPKVAALLPPTLKHGLADRIMRPLSTSVQDRPVPYNSRPLHSPASFRSLQQF